MDLISEFNLNSVRSAPVSFPTFLHTLHIFIVDQTMTKFVFQTHATNRNPGPVLTFPYLYTVSHIERSHQQKISFT